MPRWRMKHSKESYHVYCSRKCCYACSRRRPVHLLGRRGGANYSHLGDCALASPLSVHKTTIGLRMPKARQRDEAESLLGEGERPKPEGLALASVRGLSTSPSFGSTPKSRRLFQFRTVWAAWRWPAASSWSGQGKRRGSTDERESDNRPATDAMS